MIQNILKNPKNPEKSMYHVYAHEIDLSGPLILWSSNYKNIQIFRGMLNSNVLHSTTTYKTFSIIRCLATSTIFNAIHILGHYFFLYVCCCSTGITFFFMCFCQNTEEMWSVCITFRNQFPHFFEKSPVHLQWNPT